MNVYVEKGGWQSSTDSSSQFPECVIVCCLKNHSPLFARQNALLVVQIQLLSFFTFACLELLSVMVS